VRRRDARHITRGRQWRLDELPYDVAPDFQERHVESLDERDEPKRNLKKSTAALFAQPLRGKFRRDGCANVVTTRAREPRVVVAGCSAANG
jgi:hypothetical protein